MWIIFYVWSSQSRLDTPELALHFQVALIMASSEALFYGGLIQMVSRYPESILPRYVAFSIIGRCCSKFFDRAGFYYWALSWCWPNEMSAQRDLIGRHAASQYIYGAFFVIMMSMCGIGVSAVEEAYGKHFGTIYTRPIF